MILAWGKDVALKGAAPPAPKKPVCVRSWQNQLLLKVQRCLRKQESLCNIRQILITHQPGNRNCFQLFQKNCCKTDVCCPRLFIRPQIFLFYLYTDNTLKYRSTVLYYAHRLSEVFQKCSRSKLVFCTQLFLALMSSWRTFLFLFVSCDRHVHKMLRCHNQTNLKYNDLALCFLC